MTQQMPQLPPQRTFTPFAMPGQQQQQAHQAQQPQQPQQAGPVGGDGLDSPGGLTLPPTKRQRLSPPLPPSPAQSSSSPYTNSTIPYQTFPGTTVAASPGPPTPISAPRAQLQSFDMRVRPAQNVMGPPSRPAERLDRSTDLNQLSDIVMASGIDVREEENYLAESYRNQHSSYPSLYTAGQQQHYSAATPGGRFSSTWPHAGHDGLSIIPGAGPYNKPPLSMRTIEEELYDKHKKAARALAENQQYHLRDSFLAANNVRQLMSKRAYENGVIISWKGLEEKTMDTAPPAANGVTMIGADGTGVVSIRKSSTLAESAPLADMLTLLSLAANEKLRDIVEDAFRISRGRQMSSQGVVPPEWSDIAVGDSAPTPTTTLPTAVGGTAWDQLPNGTVPPLGAGTEPNGTIVLAEVRLPTPPSDSPPKPVPTISFKSNIPATLRALALSDRRAEEARLMARAKRQRLANQGSAAETTEALAASLPPAIPEMKMTKRERERIARAGQTEEVLHRAANDAASMALGGRGKSYSWLTAGGGGGGGGGSRGGSGTSTPRRMDTGLAGAAGMKSPASSGGSRHAGAAGSASGSEDVALRARDRRFGEWKEDSKRGRGIQMRDLILVLELDGQEKKTLAKCLARQRSSD